MIQSKLLNFPTPPPLQSPNKPLESTGFFFFSFFLVFLMHFWRRCIIHGKNPQCYTLGNGKHSHKVGFFCWEGGGVWGVESNLRVYRISVMTLISITQNISANKPDIWMFYYSLFYRTKVKLIVSFIFYNKNWIESQQEVYYKWDQIKKRSITQFIYQLKVPMEQQHCTSK